MLTFYKYKVDKDMMMLTDVPEPYQTQMRKAGYSDPVVDEPVEETETGDEE